MLAVYKDGLRAAMGSAAAGAPRSCRGSSSARRSSRRSCWRWSPAPSTGWPRLRRGERPALARRTTTGSRRSCCSSSSRVVGPELFCPDRRNGTISLYLVRPLRADRLRRLALGGARHRDASRSPGSRRSSCSPGSCSARPTRAPTSATTGSTSRASCSPGRRSPLYFATLATAVASYTTRRAYAAAFMVGAFVVSAAVVGSVVGRPLVRHRAAGWRCSACATCRST